jgi:hypothetical protein
VEFSHIPQFIFPLDGTRYALYVKDSDNPYYDNMFWLEVWYCEAYKKPKAKWVSDAEARISTDRLNGTPMKKRSGPRTDWERNALLMARVDQWQRRLQSEGPKAGCEKVAEELRKEGKFVPWTTIRSACDRAKQRFVLRFADYDQCPRLGTFTCSDHVPLDLPSTYRIPTFCRESSTPTAFQT